MYEWVNCPICDSCDTRREIAGEEGEYLYHCTNTNCGSNGGNNFEAVTKIKQLETKNFKLAKCIDNMVKYVEELEQDIVDGY